MIAKIVYPSGGVTYLQGDVIVVAPDAAPEKADEAGFRHLETYDRKSYGVTNTDGWGTPTSLTTIAPNTEVFILNDRGATVDRINKRVD